MASVGSSIHPQPWNHQQRPPDPWETPQNASSPVLQSQTWHSPAPAGIKQAVLLITVQKTCTITAVLFLSWLILAATGVDPFSPPPADKKGSAAPVKSPSPRPGSPSGNYFYLLQIELLHQN